MEVARVLDRAGAVERDQAFEPALVGEVEQHLGEVDVVLDDQHDVVVLQDRGAVVDEFGRGNHVRP